LQPYSLVEAVHAEPPEHVVTVAFQKHPGMVQFAAEDSPRAVLHPASTPGAVQPFALAPGPASQAQEFELHVDSDP
jgi:hypothetical protein